MGESSLLSYIPIFQKDLVRTYLHLLCDHIYCETETDQALTCRGYLARYNNNASSYDSVCFKLNLQHIHYFIYLMLQIDHLYKKCATLCVLQMHLVKCIMARSCMPREQLHRRCPNTTITQRIWPPQLKSTLIDLSSL